MACIKSAARSALVAFAPDAPYMAAGTMAGAVDLSFSSSANLEIFTVDFQSDAHELPIAGACPSTDRFNRLSWSMPPASPSDDFALGLLAGGLSDGTISVWNPLKLISSDGQDAFVASLEKHVGPVRGLEFGPHSPNLLASGADEGELCIWDLANPREPNLFPSLKNVGSGAQTEVSFVSWNPKFQPILASTSYNGMTAVWDLRQQKTVTSFSDRRRCSVLQWNPDNSTHIILASDEDNSPSLRVWDVRNTILPVREFVGHTKGVIAMSWCPNDSSYLLTCAKDNRTVCWDTTAGEIVCELPASNNWNFDIHWFPKVPGVISASSFDAKIGIYNIEACSRLSGAMGQSSAPGRLRAPKWLKRPAGASFGFGGKLVSFRSITPMPNAPSRLSEVSVQNLVTEHSLVNRSTEFEAAIQNGEKASLRNLCDKKSQESDSQDDKEIWGFLRVMLEEEGTARSKLLDHLGFLVANEGSGNTSDDLGNKLSNTLNIDEKATYSGTLLVGEGTTFPIDNGEEFFNNPQPYVDNFTNEDSGVPSVEQVPRETGEQQESSDHSFDDSIQRALIVGDYKAAVLQCISANRMADALVIAHLGGPQLWTSTRDQYLDKSQTPYLKVASALVSNDLMGLVNTRPLTSWKETLALLCTFAQDEEWTILCDTLALRLMAVGNTLAATLCYICAGNIDRTVEIWSHSLKSEHEGRTYVDLFQDLMEKTVILAFATGQKRFSASLSKLVEKYVELLASQGLLTTAMEYLNLLGLENCPHELSILWDRIALSAGGREAPRNVPENIPQQPYSAYGLGDGSQYPYQDKVHLQQQPISDSRYVGGYTQNAPHYEVHEPPQKQISPSFQPKLPPGVFVPTPQVPQPSDIPNTATMQPPPMTPFVPVTPLGDAGLYHPNTLGSQLGIGHPIPQPGRIPMPAPGFVPRPSASPIQPSSPTRLVQLATPPTPPPTVQTVDTSKVPAELRPIIVMLTRLFNETSEAVGGSRANSTKKREMEDNSKKIGSLFAKLNSGDISPSAASKLGQLCQALDSGDFAGALRIQVLLTTSDWDECNFWLTALKRMIKTRQNVRLG